MSVIYSTILLLEMLAVPNFLLLKMMLQLIFLYKNGGLMSILIHKYLTTSLH